MYSKYIWLLPILVSVYIIYSHDSVNEMNYNFVQEGLRILENIYFGEKKESNLVIKDSTKQRIFTSDELKRYTNLKDGLYVSILGQVYDVTKGAKHYGPGETYHIFTGKDASSAFITGEFNDKGLTDDISSLSAQQVQALVDWQQFYKDKYIFKGKLNGRYYNEDGTPTEEFLNVQKMLKNAKETQFQEENRRKMFPPCNVEWNPDSGTVVWCSKKSGGLERDWIGVPRMLYDSPNSEQYRCACVKLDSKEYEEFKGMVREYDGCPKTFTKCSVKANNS